MSRTRTTRRAAALALALAGGLLAAPSSADPLDPVVCALPADALSEALGEETSVDTDVTGGADWDLVDPRGKGKTKDLVGTVGTTWEVEGARCAGRTYRFTVTGAAPLGWTTTAAGATAADGTASGPGVTTTSADGSAVTVSFVAGQDTQSFAVTGTTAGYGPLGACVDIALSVSGPDGSKEYESGARLCDDSVGGTSYR